MTERLCEAFDKTLIVVMAPTGHNSNVQSTGPVDNWTCLTTPKTFVCSVRQYKADQFQSGPSSSCAGTKLNVVPIAEHRNVLRSPSHGAFPVFDSVIPGCCAWPATHEHWIVRQVSRDQINKVVVERLHLFDTTGTSNCSVAKSSGNSFRGTSIVTVATPVVALSGILKSSV